MVNKLWMIALLSLAFPVFADVKVNAEADQVDHFENLPIPVTIMVTHPENEHVDEASFALGKENIIVQKVKDVHVDPFGRGDIISIYQYKMPAKAKGLYVLPVLTVKVGTGAYRSIASTFEVKERGDNVRASPPPVSSSSAPVSSEGAFLKLETIVNGATTLYPGQSITVGYRYSFNANIETTEEVTPLFDPKGFLKVGDKVVKNQQTADVSVLEVTQQLEAQIPGVYEMGPSKVAGFVYTEDSQGRRAYAKNKLQSVAPVVTLTIKVLPEENHPASFKGAIGQYTFNVSLKTPSKVTVGDEMTLSVEIAGKGDLESVQLPDLCCQPGMSGVFKLSDLPPAGQIAGQTKRFTVLLRPLTAAVKEIPSLEFSYFDPGKQKFEALHSSPIPIQVVDLPVKEEAAPSQKESGEDWNQKIRQPSPIQIEANYPLTQADLENRWFASWWMLFLIPLAAVLLVYQRRMKRSISSQTKPESAVNSEVLYEEAVRAGSRSPHFYTQLTHAFFKRLQERGDIDASVQTIQQLPSQGAAGDVKEFLTKLEACRYSGASREKEAELLRFGDQLFKELGAHA